MKVCIAVHNYTQSIEQNSIGKVNAMCNTNGETGCMLPGKFRSLIAIRY